MQWGRPSSQSYRETFGDFAYRVRLPPLGQAGGAGRHEKALLKALPNKARVVSKLVQTRRANTIKPIATGAFAVAHSPMCRAARRASSCSRWREAAAQCSTGRVCWLSHTSVSACAPLHALIFHPPHCTSRRNTCKSSGGKHEAPRARRCLPPLFLPLSLPCSSCAQLLSAVHVLQLAELQAHLTACACVALSSGRRPFVARLREIPSHVSTFTVVAGKTFRLSWWGFTRAEPKSTHPAPPLVCLARKVTVSALVCVSLSLTSLSAL